jgi:hypothetical protein
MSTDDTDERWNYFFLVLFKDVTARCSAVNNQEKVSVGSSVVIFDIGVICVSKQFSSFSEPRCLGGQQFCQLALKAAFPRPSPEIRIKTPIASHDASMKDPPYEKNGSGIPVIGIRFNVIPTFTST